MKEQGRLSKRAYIARTIAAEFGDEARLPAYLNLCQRHGLPLVLRAFAEAKAMPAARIKRSRVALFHYLLKIYAAERKQNHRP